MMKHNTKYSILSVAVALAVAAFGSCQRDELVDRTPAGENILNFSVGFAGSGEIVLSKGATLASEDGTVSIPLSCAVTDGINVNLPGVAESAKATKGTQINSEAEFLAAGLTSFTAAGWNADKTGFIPSSTAVSYSDGLWRTADTYRWRGSGSKTFLAYATLSSNATVTNSVNPSVKQTFTYTVPTDARQQNDVMLGWYEGDGGGTSTAAITMVHPLTAVVFKKGEMEGITAIKSISISGVYVSGTADVTYALSDGDVVPTYNWGSSRTGSQTVTLSPAGEATELEVADDGKIGTSFIILPQTVAAGALTLTITVVKDGEEAVLLADVPAGTWLEGKTNTFTIGYEKPIDPLLPGLFSVSISEYVQFSRGNLYCTRSSSEGSYTYDFGLEQHQYDFHTRPEGPSAINGVYDEEGTDPNMSGHFYWDIAKAQAGKDYGAFSTTAPSGGTTSDVLDWGPALDAASHWTTLSSGEWNYLISTRKVKSASGLGNTCQFVIVKGVKGLIIYPDDYDGDMFTSLQEITVIPTGCVFIPMAGKFVSGGITNVNERCNYWTSTHGDAGGNAIQFLAYGTVCHANNLLSRANGMSVRLVQKFKKPLPEIEFIDLGLPSGTLWADMNLGAYGEDDYGNYYAWGEILPYHADGYSKETPLTHFRSMTTGAGNTDITGYNSHTYSQNGSTSFLEWTTKPYDESTNELMPQYDAASYAITGARTPSYEEWVELNTNCTWTWTGNHNGTNIAGYIVTSNVEGYKDRSIFLPATGIYSNVTFTNLGTRASYLSRTRRSDNAENAYVIYIHSTLHQPDYSGSRCNGFPVRAVKKRPVEYVEIGGLKWATCNVGANTPKDYGWYFSWAGKTGYVRNGSKWVTAQVGSELSGGFSWANTPYHTGDVETINWTKYIPTGKGTYWSGGGSPDNKLSLDIEDDAVRANLGGSWRMPTQADFQTLYQACGGTGPTALSSANPGKGIYWVSNTQAYISDYAGVAGILFCDGTSKLFFVAAGYGDNGKLTGGGTEGRYWSATVFSTNPQNAYRLGFQNGSVSPENVNGRNQGYPVRPVSN